MAKTNTQFLNFFGFKRWYLIYPLLMLQMGIFLLPRPVNATAISDEEIIRFTNLERSRSGLGQVTASQLLAKAAYEKALAIMAAQEFRHDIDGKRFSAWIIEAGYEYSYVGENLAMDFTTCEGAVMDWMESPTHRKNILNSIFSEIGVAVLNGRFDGSDTALIVQIFGAPKTTLVKTAARLPAGEIPAQSAAEIKTGTAESLQPSREIKPILSAKASVFPANRAFLSAPREPSGIGYDYNSLASAFFYKRPGYNYLILWLMLLLGFVIVGLDKKFLSRQLILHQ